MNINSLVVIRRSKDDSLWTKHVMGDAKLVGYLNSVPDGSRHRFAIGDRSGTFEKMQTGKDGRSVAGFRPCEDIKDWWQRSKYDAEGTISTFAYLGSENP